MNSTMIALILRALASAASLTDVFGKRGERAAPILDTIAGFVELPLETRAEQEALLEQVRGWVRENRGPTDAELDAFKARRDQLDAQLRAIRSNLEGSTP